ncbi:hypothetical protein QTP88_013147 [Uroleucon formosanum]
MYVYVYLKPLGVLSIAAVRETTRKCIKIKQYNIIINREVKTINKEIVVDDDHRQVTITVIGDWSIAVKLDVFMSFVTGMHLEVPLTSALTKIEQLIRLKTPFISETCKPF